MRFPLALTTKIATYIVGKKLRRVEKFATVQMLDVHLPTTDERTVILSRYTQPESDVQLLLERLKLELPAQPPPKIISPKAPGQSASVVM